MSVTLAQVAEAVRELERAVQHVATAFSLGARTSFARTEVTRELAHATGRLAAARRLLPEEGQR